MTCAPFPKRLLIADDDSEFRQILSVEFTARGYDVATASSLRSYRELESFGVVAFSVPDLCVGPAN
jgi:ActR/RegA family two-component response regulator